MSEGIGIIAGLSPAKQALLKLRLKQSTGGALVSAIPRRSRAGPIPLSFAQQRLWFLDQLYPGHPAYNVPRTLRLQGQLNLAALQQALNSIVERHEALRTTFRSEGGNPVQVIGRDVGVQLGVIPLTGTPEERENTAQRLATEEVRRPFHLDSDLMLRSTLLRLSDEDHILVLVTHHIASDGWSRGILFRDLAAFYSAAVASQPCSLPELPIQYADFSIWQREWMQGEVLQKQLAYWRQQLANIPARLELPSDRPQPAVPSFQGAKQFPVFPKSVLDGLKSLSQREGVTLFMTLLAAFQVLLHRYTGSEDILVGTPIAGRNFKEIEPLIGDFVNVLLLRGDLSANPRFREVLGRIRKTALEAYENQDVPFEKLVEELERGRDRNQSSLFQVAFALESSPAKAPELPGLIVTPLNIDSGTAKADLSLTLAEDATGLKAKLEYSTEIFDAATIGRMSGHFQELLEGIVANPDRRLLDLPVLSDAERRQVLFDFNVTAKEYRRDFCIHQMFEAQAELTPDSIALVCGKERLTYRELNARASQLGRYLRKRGVGPEQLVGIFAERSPEMLVGILGILKAGGAYVPLDPAYPKERIGFILEDAKAPIILTQQRLVQHLPAQSSEVIRLDEDWGQIAQEPAENLKNEAKPENLSYVLFTSGSTGRPKGVAIEHRSTVAFIHWAKDVFTAQQLQGVLFSTSICFDLSVYEMFVPLSAGGKVILAENVLQLPTLPAGNEVTLINTVPSAIAELLRMEGVPDSVHTVNLAGEPLPASLVQQIYSTNTVRRVLNLYGPTEDTTYSTFTLVEKGARVTIGRPIANSQTYILDRLGQPIPIGVPGELYLGGEGLARGYYGRPDLTAERFVPNPFSSQSGARLYRTGDLVKFLPDGNIDYLGRIDNQVKLRGFRIELGEIEALLGHHPAVQQTLVLAQDTAAGDKRLVAYVVPVGLAPGVKELRNYLKQSLPEYMIPSAFVLLDKFPLTPNGKVDRKALVAAEDSLSEPEHEFVAPSTPVEEALAAIWSELLGVDRIGVHDNFFELGGHSLMATRVVSRIRDAFQLELPLRLLFEAPTISELATRIIESFVQNGEPEEIAQMLDKVEAANNSRAG